MTRNWEIPLCRSEFLQDFSIELGRCFTPHAPFRFFNVKAETCRKDQSVEGLALLAGTLYDTGARLIVWEDQQLWVDVVLWPSRNTAECWLGFYRSCDGFTYEQIVEAFRDTVNCSMRLCYREWPLEMLCRIWKYTGEVEMYGDLTRPQKTQP